MWLETPALETDGGLRGGTRSSQAFIVPPVEMPFKWPEIMYLYGFDRHCPSVPEEKKNRKTLQIILTKIQLSCVYSPCAELYISMVTDYREALCSLTLSHSPFYL